MNHRDVPPKPVPPPTAGLPTVPAAEYGVPAAGPPAPIAGQRPPGNDVLEQDNAAVPGTAEASRGSISQQTLWKSLFVVVLVAVIGALAWLALWLNSGGDQEASAGSVPGTLETAVTPPATPLPLPREAEPAGYAVGDCFSDFDPEALKSTIVPCDTGHSAQLVAVFHYPEGGPYPGAEALKAKALEVCQAAQLGAAADDFALDFERSFPSAISWDAGDRRLDCYVTSPGGNNVNASVLP